MKKNFFLGLFISTCNLLFFTLAMDLLFSSGIYEQLIGFDVKKFFGTNSVFVGIISTIIAIALEIVSYRVILSEESKGNSLQMK